jgi:hypothetical protein
VTVGRFEKDFLDARQRGLSRYLQRVIAHPELSSSHLLVIFLQSDEGAFARAMEDSKSSRPKMTTSAVTWLEGKVNSIAYGKPEIDRTPEDIRVEEMGDYVQKLEKQLAAVSKHSENLAKRLKDTGAAMFEMGGAFSILGQTDVSGASADIVEFANTVEKSSNAYSSLAEAALVRFQEPLEEQLRLLGSVRSAITRRADRKRAYVTALTDVDAKGAAMRKAQATPGKDSSSKEAALQGAEAMRDAAKADFERVTDRLLQEFDSFQEKKVQEMQWLMAQYVDFQVAHVRSVESLWEELAPRLQSHVMNTSSNRNSKNANSFASGSHQNQQYTDLRSAGPPPLPNSPPPVPPNPFGSHGEVEEHEEFDA